MGDHEPANQPPQSHSRTITVAVGQLRANTAELISQIAAGATIFVLRRGQVVARIDSPTSAHYDKATESATIVSVTELRGRAGWLLDDAARGARFDIIKHGNVVGHLRKA
ncbi:hypothetical protein Q9Q75_12685 [Mycobacterium intracellulare]|uniref:type II toxin-antitoxin system Phd/YefM family antitoxin n=1 Tax=Mycobacterium intracellulare TaxID=1767 RepID=UPI00334FD7E4